MKRFMCFFAVVCYVAVTAFAQTTTGTDSAAVSGGEDYGRRIIINKFSEDWEVGARVGTQAYLGEYVHSYPYFKFKDWWTFPAFDLTISKWATHSIGATLGFTFSPFKSLYRASEKSYQYVTFYSEDDEKYAVDPAFRIARGYMGNAYLQAMFDMGNVFFGYKPDRFFTVLANIGGGVLIPIGDTKYRDLCASFNAGLIGRFSLSQNLFLDLAIRGTLHDDMFNGISYYTSDDNRNISVDATLGATVGISYRFDLPKRKKKNNSNTTSSGGWHSVEEVLPQTVAYVEVKNELAVSQEKLVTAVKEKENAEAALAEAKLKLEEANSRIMKDRAVRYCHLVNFVIDTWTISNRERVGIRFAAEFIKDHPDKLFFVKSYADVQTASPEHNKMLSQNRSQAVYDCLVKEFGVDPKQLQKSDFGGVDYMFYNDPQCTRSTIIVSQDYGK